MILNNRASQTVAICCDWCDARVVASDFNLAIQIWKAKADGRIFQKKGIWRHCCGKCRHKTSEPTTKRPPPRFVEDTLPVVLPSPTAAQILDRKKRRLDFDDQEVKAPVVSARKLDL